MKRCTKCGINKDISEFGKLKDSHGVVAKYYPKHYCLDCERAYARAWNKKKSDAKPKKPVVITEKICTKCNRILSVDKFGRHNDKRCNGSIKIRISTYCLECNNNHGKKRYRVLKENPEFQEQNKSRAKNYYHTNKDVCAKKSKAYRGTEDAKEKRKINWHKTKNIYKDRINKSLKRYYKDNIDNLKDHYIIVQLEKEGVNRELTKQHPELIEAKRLQLLIKRKIKQHGNTN